LRLKCTKFDFRAPGPLHVAVFKGPTSKGRAGEEGMEGKGREEEGEARRGEGREGDWGGARPPNILA